MKKNQSKFTLKIIATLCLLFAGIAFVAGASDGNEKKIEGSWRGTVTAVNPPLGSFASLITLEDKNTVLESRRLYVPESPFGPLLETGGHGAWVKVGQNEYQVNFTFLIQGAPDNAAHRGEPIGTDNISLRLSLGPDGKTLSGTFQSQIKDEAGNTIFVATGTYTAARIEAAS
jgi:hypothetical protein